MKYDDMTVKISIRLFKGEKAFGPGIAELLENIDRDGSLHKAAKSMNIAYSKAWKILKESEKALGFELVLGKRGGVSGGGSLLSDEGREILLKYREFEKRVKYETEKIFNDIF